MTPRERAEAVLGSVYQMRWPEEDYAKVAAAIEAAEEAMRERCARVAEAVAEENFTAAGRCADVPAVWKNDDLCRARAREAMNIARDIREEP